MGIQNIKTNSCQLLQIAVCLRGLYICVFVFSTFTIVTGQTVVINSNLEFVPESSFFGNHRGTVYQDAARTDPTSVWFDYIGGHLTAVSWNLDVESDWYVVDIGEVLGFETIASDQFVTIFTSDNPRPPVFVGFDEFYLGVATTGEGVPISYPDRNVFGWLRLRNASGQLEMVENAMAYNSRGIVVGTAGALPPSAKCDFDYNGHCTVNDLNILLDKGPVATGVPVDDYTYRFDLRQDGVIDNSDVDEWLAEAAEDNGVSSSYKRGDANLDGNVDVSDFNDWNAARFTETLHWDKGDFNGDGIADVSDFNIWNGNKFRSSDIVHAVPEPFLLGSMLAMVLCVVAHICRAPVFGLSNLQEKDHEA